MQGKANTVPAWYALAQQAQRMGMAPWDLEAAMEHSPRVARWMRRLQAAWALEGDDTITRMRD